LLSRTCTRTEIHGMGLDGNHHTEPGMHLARFTVLKPLQNVRFAPSEGVQGNPGLSGLTPISKVHSRF
jgi:hypothetical protein